MDVLVSKPDFQKSMKICDRLPCPENLPKLSVPELPLDADETIDRRIVKNDERIRNDQRCSVSIISAMSTSLDVVLQLKDTVPELVPVADLLLDGISLASFLHHDLTSMRRKGVQQLVNPSYMDMFSGKSSEPDLLLGKSSIAGRIKNREEMSKIKAKLKKPEVNTTQKRDFRKGGEFARRKFREPRPWNKTKEEFKRRYSSPKGAYRKVQQDRAQGNQKRPQQQQNFKRN